ncbi:glycosyltransferase family 2 protein [Methylobacterium sp. CM6257]
MSSTQLRRLDHRPIKLEGSAVPLIAPMKNEKTILPDFLRHYRGLGVAAFFIIDDHSDDGSLDYLLDQPDCHVFQSDGGFRQARYGADWMNEILNAHCTGRWCLVVDCDEFLYYEDCERVPLPEFCERIGQQGADTVYASMIDMYPSGSFRKAAETGAASVIEQMPYFDADYLFRPWPQRPWDPTPVPFFLQVIGGPRLRLQSSLDAESRRGAWHQTICNQVDRFVDRLPASALPALAAIWPIELPAQQKRPLNYVRAGFTYHNPHGNSNTRLADTVTALAHYKFLGALDRRLERSDILHQHYRRGLSYLQIQRAIDRFGSESLLYPGSVRLRSSTDLSAVGLIGANVARLWHSPTPIREIRTSLTA